jgi:hypothetical protein
VTNQLQGPNLSREVARVLGWREIMPGCLGGRDIGISPGNGCENQRIDHVPDYATDPALLPELLAWAAQRAAFDLRLRYRDQGGRFHPVLFTDVVPKCPAGWWENGCEWTTDAEPICTAACRLVLALHEARGAKP